MASDDDLKDSLKAATSAKKPAMPKPVAASKAPVPPPKLVNEPAAIEDVFHDGKNVAYPTAVVTGILGTGQGGCRIAKAFWDLGYRHVGAFNTTEVDFAGLPEEMPRFSMNIGGAAKDAALAGKTLDGRDQDVWDLMNRAWGDDPELILITASLGGGTRSGTAARLVEMARQWLRSKGRPEPARSNWCTTIQVEWFRRSAHRSCTRYILPWRVFRRLDYKLDPERRAHPRNLWLQK